MTKITDAQLTDALTHVFQTYGYEGATLSRISQATGLQRASLYHRFPGGKEAMARFVLAGADELFAGELLAPLGESGDPKARVREMANRLAGFYDGGRRSCLLDTLSLGDSDEVLRPGIGASIRAWIGAMAGLAREAGLAEPEAQRRAEEALVRIQGSLVVARSTGDPGVVERTFESLPALLTDPNTK